MLDGSDHVRTRPYKAVQSVHGSLPPNEVKETYPGNGKRVWWSCIVTKGLWPLKGRRRRVWQAVPGCQSQGNDQNVWELVLVSLNVALLPLVDFTCFTLSLSRKPLYPGSYIYVTSTLCQIKQWIKVSLTIQKWFLEFNLIIFFLIS